MGINLPVKKSRIYFINIVLFLFLTSCNKLVNLPERNHLLFCVNITSIIDSIYQLNLLIKKIPPYKNLDIIYFDYLNSSLRINTEELGRISIENLHNTIYFNEFTKDELENFISLFNYLYKQNLKPAFYNKSLDIIYYSYRDYYEISDPGDYHTDLIRYVLILNSEGNKFRSL